MSGELELACPGCHAAQVCGPTLMLEKLQGIGLLRREKSPSIELLQELMRSSADRLGCPQCGYVGMTVRAPQEETWPGVRRCQGCRQPIAAERLEVFPNAERCAACESQGSSASGEDREFCPRCGNVLTVRLQSGRGLSRYVTSCPECGHRP